MFTGIFLVKVENVISIDVVVILSVETVEITSYVRHKNDLLLEAIKRSGLTKKGRDSSFQFDYLPIYGKKSRSIVIKVG